MSVREILRMGDARLLRQAESVTDFGTPELDALIADMFDTMRAANGAGLAAPAEGAPTEGASATPAPTTPTPATTPAPHEGAEQADAEADQKQQRQHVDQQGAQHTALVDHRVDLGVLGAQRVEQLYPDTSRVLGEDLVAVLGVAVAGLQLEPELLRMVCTRSEEMGKVTGGKTIPQIAASLATAGAVAALAPPAWIIVATSILAAKIAETESSEKTLRIVSARIVVGAAGAATAGPGAGSGVSARRAAARPVRGGRRSSPSTPGRAVPVPASRRPAGRGRAPARRGRRR